MWQVPSDRAVAIAPTKDNYWSTDIQTGSAYGDFAKIKESYNRLQAAVSTLSKGPVAPSDKIGRSDTALIMKSCAANGKLLQVTPRVGGTRNQLARSRARLIATT